MPDKDVTLKVPEGKVADLYRWVAAWEDGGQVAVPANHLGPYPDKQWRDTDIELAASLLGTLSPAAREVIWLLGDQLGAATSWRSVAAKIGTGDRRSVAQQVADIAVAAHCVGRASPIRSEESGDGAFYWLDKAAGPIWRGTRPPNADAVVEPVAQRRPRSKSPRRPTSQPS